MRFIIKVFVVFLLLTVLMGGAVGYWGYKYITRDLPNFASVDDYRPPAVTRVYAKDKSLIAEFYTERRYPAKLSEIPLRVLNAFLAAEDASFYQHSGIDPTSIIRAALKNFQSGASRQGGSTITQQVVKNLLLTSEKNIKRKLKEAILAYRLEKRLSKDGILEIYLNQIFFGNNAYGIKSAARSYFHKELAELTLGEAALLASLPKAPTAYSPLKNMPRAKRRQKYVLSQMLKAGFINKDELEKASNEKLEVFESSEKNIFASPYYAGEIRRIFQEDARLKQLNLDSDGLEIYTPLDVQADKKASQSLRAGLRVVDKRRGWRGPIKVIADTDREQFRKLYGQSKAELLEAGEVVPAMVLQINKAQGTAVVDLGHKTGLINLRSAEWAKKRLDKQDNSTFAPVETQIRPGDVIEVSKATTAQPNKSLPQGIVADLQLDQTPDIEGGLVLLNPNTGEVVSMVGGYSYEKSQFNRVTQSLRQPGSSFKPIVYLAAVDKFKYGAASIVDDRPETFKVGDQYWTPQNFDEKFLGSITLQKALEHSRNLVSVQIASRIGLSPIIEYAHKLGIKSPLGKNLSLALGSSEVTMLELTRAYGVLAAKGVLFKSSFISRVTDRFGNEVINFDNERLLNAAQVIDEKSAFIMSHMMKGVIERGTATSIKAINRPVGGKTGTTNDCMDTWFIGFTPDWVAGVWVGFDLKKPIGKKETGGKVSAPIWLNFMQWFLEMKETEEYNQLVKDSKSESERLGLDFTIPERLPPHDFSPPAGVVPVWMNLVSGAPQEPGSAGAALEYFVEGSEPQPTAFQDETQVIEEYLDSPDL